MSAAPQSRHGGRILADALVAHGVKLAFGVPGESYLPVLDGIHARRDQLRFVICRQEGGAAYMAEACAKLAGEPGVVFVTRGPGATNGSVGVHTAMQDSTPMVVFVGQVGTDMCEREAFQEIDFRRMYGPLTKWVGQIDRVGRIPEYVSHAFHTAMAGRPGPVLLALPEDMLYQEASVSDTPRYRTVRGAPSPGDIAELGRLLCAAERPLMIAGGGGWDPGSLEALRDWTQAAGLPVACSFRRQDYLDNRQPNYAGDIGFGINPKLAQRVKDADLLIVAGARLGEIATAGYTLIEVPVPRQTLVHVHAGPEELGRVYAARLPINSGMAQFVAALQPLKVEGARWQAWTREAREDYEAWAEPKAMPGDVQLGEIVSWLSETLPEDAIVTNGAGNFAVWLNRHFRYKRSRTQLAPTSGSMGYSVPSAVGAAIAHPSRTVVGWAGDGDFLMNGQELATAVQYDAAPILIVVNNGMYGTIRMHQEREFPERVSGTELKNPDFAAYARAFGGHGERVERTADFAPAFERARASGKAAVIELRIDPDAITPNTTLSAIRDAALKRR
ncbi:MAG: thiamine pyrophosphate-binding protein [Betaproteobacteria bacterium RIFCSPLOWO2_02_FULL_66_14]|nr:MAG: thiamine pyrophosphate-binding protein [Betaproteobacteria bacterium RIFCSPLOWO2_02_FULL_66_14]